jgi:hypothetical protein
MKVKTIAFIGAGTIGRGIAYVCSGRLPRPQDWARRLRLFREQMTAAAPAPCPVCEISTFLF